MPSKEYYRKLKKEAHDLYVREGMTCKEISTRINVSERSVSSWINENDALWKKERQASVISSQKQGDNLKHIRITGWKEPNCCSAAKNWSCCA